MFGTLAKGDVLLTDSAYDSDALRTELEARGVLVNIRLLPQRILKPPFSATLYTTAMKILCQANHGR